MRMDLVGLGGVLCFSVFSKFVIMNRSHFGKEKKSFGINIYMYIYTSMSISISISKTFKTFYFKKFID